MKITESDFEKIKGCFPLQRGNVKMSNLDTINAILYVAENGCKWRRLPAEFGNWHTVYRRMNRWAKSGVLNSVFAQLQHCQVLKVNITHVSLDSTSVKVHPDGTGALKNLEDNQSDSLAEVVTPKFIWLPQMIVRQ